MKNLLVIFLLTTCFFVGAQTPVTTSDFELFGDHIFVKLSVDGSEPLDFIMDTGDGLTVIDLDVAKSLNLPLDHKQATTSAQGSITGALIKHNKIELNGMLLEKNIKVYATDLDHLEISIGRNIDGIIGYDMLHHHIVRLNYDQMKIEVYDSGSYPKVGEVIPFKFHTAIPTISAYVTLNDGASIEGDFFVNTGAGTTLDFNTPFANSNNIVDRTGDHYSYLVKGLGDKETRHYEGRVKSFRFGTISYDDMPIGISQVQAGIQGDKKVAGIIGNRILSRFNILFDYKGHKMYLEPNSRKDGDFYVNSSGLDVQMDKDMSKVLIHQVIEGSQGEKAGIKLNDELVAIDGKSVADMTLIDVENILKTPGKTVELTINSGGTEKKVSIELKKLL